MSQEEPDYRAFARDLLRICKKNGVRVTACAEGFVGIGPEGLKFEGEYAFTEFQASGTSVKLSGGWVSPGQRKEISITKE